MVDGQEGRGHVIDRDMDGELRVGFGALVCEGEEGYDGTGGGAVSI